jgi:hypothetical protein
MTFVINVFPLWRNHNGQVQQQNSVKAVRKEKIMTPQQIPVVAGNLVIHQGAFAALTTEEGQWVNKNTKEAIGVMIQAVKTYRLQKIFKPIFTDIIFIVEALGGERIDDTELVKVFPGGVDPDIKSRRLNEPGAPTEEISPKVYELHESEKFYFSDEWDKFFTWHQVVRICGKYPQLFEQYFLTLFPVKKGEKRLVASVNVYGGGLNIDVYRLGNYELWSADYRFRLVVPQSLYL